MTQTTYLVLGLLAERPRSGYEIKRAVDASARFFWAISFSQIYDGFRQLEREGLIAAVGAPVGGRRRMRYRLEPAGKDALRSWLLSEEEPRVEVRHTGLLKYSFAHLLDAKQEIKLLELSRRCHDRMRVELEGLSPLGEEIPGRPLPSEVAECGRLLHATLADWFAAQQASILLESDNSPSGRGAVSPPP